MKILFFFSLFLVFAGCAPANKEESEVKFELLNYASKSFAGAYSGAKICVTGPYAIKWRSRIGAALMEWQRQLKKVDSEAILSVGYTCDKPDFRVETYSTTGRAHAFRNGKIRLYKNSTNATILHEFGHAFAGLGDTYVEGVWTCKPGQPLSLMCSTKYGAKVFRDDFLGMRASFRKHASLKRPVRVFKKALNLLSRKHKCDRNLNQFITSPTPGISYKNGKPSLSYIRAKLEEEEVKFDFPYGLPSTSISRYIAHDLWQQISENEDILDNCELPPI